MRIGGKWKSSVQWEIV